MGYCIRTFAKRTEDAVVPVDISDIDGTLPGSAMLVYKRIKEAGMDFFVEYDLELSYCNSVSSFYGMTWIADV
jgi:hypothetical protein